MNIIVSVVGLWIGTISILGIIAPGILRDFIDRMKKKAGFGFAVGGRIGSGILFIVAAPQCLLSDFIYVIGLLIIAGGCILAIAGPKRFEALINWWTALSAFEIRAWTCVSALFAGFLIYASGWPAFG